MTGTCLAHSARKGFPPQSYAEHLSAVAREAARFAAEAEAHAPVFRGELEGIVRNAAALHDLGKLHADNQAVLHETGGTRRHLPRNHVDAGCAALLNEGALFSALTVFAHHAGLPDIPDESARDRAMLRDAHPGTRNKVDQELPRLLRLHRSLCPEADVGRELPVKGDLPMFLRMALSCLADADHADTAAVYGHALEQNKTPALRARERLEALDRYVAELGGQDERSRLRREMYDACRGAATNTSFSLCDSPVGSGKTTAVMAHLLQQALQHGARRIFVVLPYTNIIRQSVEVYRKALTLPGESPEDVVAELHFRADYQDKETRYLTSLWRAPIIVTTAVAFFGTLASSRPSALRRLHELPGNVILLDEAHCSLPMKLLPLAWRWMNVLADEWGCRWVLASGSLVRYWELGSLADLGLPRPAMTELTDGTLRRRLAAYEAGRVTFRSMDRPLSRRELIAAVQARPGPRLLIVNTVRSAAVLAEDIRNLYGREHVEHLSTALTPKDREAAIERVFARLADEHDTDWTLVATSCAEAGVNFSFRMGFREIASLTSLLQTAGRVSRHGEFPDAEVWSFSLQDDSMLTRNHELRCSASVLARYLKNGTVISPELSTRSLNDEIIVEGGVTHAAIEQLLQYESDLCFRELDRRFEPIESDTVPAVVDARLAEEIAQGRGDWRSLQRNAVAIPRKKIQAWALEEIAPGVYRWTLGYDPFLGSMRGVLDARWPATD